jgi:hypothetical protein
MDDAFEARVTQLQKQSDELARDAAAKHAEAKQLLDNAKAAGREAGNKWAMNPNIRIERVRNLVGALPRAIEEEVWPNFMASEFASTQNTDKDLSRSETAIAYRKAFIEEVKEMLRHVRGPL